MSKAGGLSAVVSMPKLMLRIEGLGYAFIVTEIMIPKVEPRPYQYLVRFTSVIGKDEYEPLSLPRTNLCWCIHSE